MAIRWMTVTEVAAGFAPNDPFSYLGFRALVGEPGAFRFTWERSASEQQHLEVAVELDGTNTVWSPVVSVFPGAFGVVDYSYPVATNTLHYFRLRITP